jgi:hypothetical protein
MKYLVFFALAILVLFGNYAPAYAHPLANGVNHDTVLGIENNHVVVVYNLRFFYQDLEAFYNSIDANKDKQISPEEGNHWATETLGKKFWLTYQNEKFIPQSARDFSSYDSIKDLVFLNFQFKLDFGAISIDPAIPHFEMEHTYTIESIDQQDWNFSYQNGNGLEITNLKYPNKQKIEADWTYKPTSNNTSLASQNSSSDMSAWIWLGIICSLLVLFLGLAAYRKFSAYVQSH